MANHTTLLQYRSLLSCKVFLFIPNPTFYCSLPNSVAPFPSFWSIPHPRWHCSLFLFRTAWGSDLPFLRLLLCVKASSNAWPLHLKKCGWMRYDYLASPGDNKKGLRPSIHCFHFFFSRVTRDALSWARTAAQNRTYLTLRGAAACSRIFSWRGACRAFSVWQVHRPFLCLVPFCSWSHFCLKLLLSSTHLNCPITETAQTKEQKQVWEKLVGTKRAGPESQLLLWFTADWAACMSVGD